MSEMQTLFPEPQYKQSKCKHCSTEFTQKYLYIAKEWRPLGYDYCPGCLRKWQELQDKKQKQEKAIDYNKEKREEWRNLRIPPKYLSKNFDNFIAQGGNLKAIHSACLKYANEFPFAYKKYLEKEKHAYSSLMLSSFVGTGKTHLACAIGHRILDKWNGENIPCPIYFISEGEIYRRIIATYSYTHEEKIDKPSEDDIVNYLIKVPILILDDLGKEERNDLRFIQRIMFNIIDGRYRIMRPMIVTSNKSSEELMTYLGDSKESACVSRLVEMCKGNSWQIEAEDYRAK
jgi:DNA replication protein DnaC